MTPKWGCMFTYQVSNTGMTQGRTGVTANEDPVGIPLSWEEEGKPTGTRSSPSGPSERANTKKARILSGQQRNQHHLGTGEYSV